MPGCTGSRIQFYAWIYLEQDTALCLGIPGVGYRSMYGCTWIQSYTCTRIHPFAWHTWRFSLIYGYTWSRIQPFTWIYLEQDTTFYLGIPGGVYMEMDTALCLGIPGVGYSPMPGYTWSRIQPYVRVYLEQDKTRSQSRNLAFSISSLLLHLLKLNNQIIFH